MRIIIGHISQFRQFVFCAHDSVYQNIPGMATLGLSPGSSGKSNNSSAA